MLLSGFGRPCPHREVRARQGKLLKCTRLQSHCAQGCNNPCEASSHFNLKGPSLRFVAWAHTMGKQVISSTENPNIRPPEAGDREYTDFSSIRTLPVLVRCCCFDLQLPLLVCSGASEDCFYRAGATQALQGVASPGPISNAWIATRQNARVAQATPGKVQLTRFGPYLSG